MNGPKLTINRHYGLDWLRIAAFAILIAYHSAMYVGPLNWVVKVANPSDWLAYPLNAISPWRLMVLFAVSGYASAAMMERSGGLIRFFAERSKRLLIPLLFGMVILVPPQSWVRLAVEGYTHSYRYFWLHDEFRFGAVLGHTMPHWEHLWFLGYLWLYTLLLIAAACWVPGWKQGCAKISRWLSHGHRLLLVPVAIIGPLRLLMVKEGLADHGMFDDFIGDEHYIPAFFFGYLLACQPLLWGAIRRSWRAAALLSAIALAALMLATFWTLSGADMPTLLLAIENIADSAMAWAMIIVALHLADRLLNRDGKWRRILAEVVFPAYLVHQTIIVVVGWYLLRFDLANALTFAVIAVAVIAGSAFTYRLARSMGRAGIVLGVNAGLASPVKAAAATSP